MSKGKVPEFQYWEYREGRGMLGMVGDGRAIMIPRVPTEEDWDKIINWINKRLGHGDQEAEAELEARHQASTKEIWDLIEQNQRPKEGEDESH